jgi:glycosyltransferase involved in cell wall biosynthesis
MNQSPVTSAAGPHLSIISPVYRAEGCLLELHRRLVDAAGKVTPHFEIVLVEDCGGDRSWEIIQELAARDPRVKGLQLSRNFGQHQAITAGLDAASGDWTVILDCDLQDKPEDILRLYAEAAKGYDVVIARRATRHDPWSKRVAARVFSSVFSLLAGYRYDGAVGAFRIMSRPVVEALRSMRERMRSLVPLGYWVGFATGYIEVEHAPRAAGRSAYSWRRLFSLAIGNIVAFSDRPLRLSIVVGFAMSACAMAYGLWIIGHALLHDIPVPGWSSLMVSLYFIGGLILANLGVIGVYLARTFDETKRRPLYLIAKTTGAAPPQARNT